MEKKSYLWLAISSMASLILCTLPLVAWAAPGNSVQERLERLEALLNDVNENVDDIVLGRNSASLNASVCVNTGVGTALSLSAQGELGARWDIAFLADGHADLTLGLTGNMTMSSNVCIDVPIVTIGKTSIATDGSERITLKTQSGKVTKLTAAESQDFEDALAKVAGELESMGLSMGQGVSDLWDNLDAASVMTPDGNPLLHPEEMLMGIPEVLMTGSIAGTPFAKLPMASDAEATMKGIIENMNPCELVKMNSMLSDMPGMEDLVCDNPLMGGITDIANGVNALPGTINDGVNSVNSTVNNGFNSLTNTVNDGFVKVGGDISNSLSSTWVAIDGATSTITGEVGGQIAQATDTLHGYMSSVNTNLKNSIDGGFSLINGAISQVKSLVENFKSAVDPALGVIDDIWDKIKKILDKIP